MTPADPPAALTALAKALRQADDHVFTGVYTGLGTASMAICRCGWQGRDWDGHRAEAVLHDGFLALPASERAAIAAELSAGTVELPPGQAPAHDEEPR